MRSSFTFRNRTTGASESHDLDWYRGFLEDHVVSSGLQIGPHLPRIGGDPVFVVAATGVGKTVAVPVHLFVWLCDQLAAAGQGPDPMPFILVVEPTIPICRSEAEHMNRSFQAFLASRGVTANVHPFGAVTGAFKFNADAPIRFVTTGVFERMADRLDPERCRVVIDEAHRVLAQSPGVEIATCVARSHGVLVDWMSATVDTSSLTERFGVKLVLATEQRFPILKVPTHAPLDECVADLAVRCLMRPSDIVPVVESFRDDQARRDCARARLHLLSPSSFLDPDDRQTYPGLRERAQGMLVVVNSHQGENSDTRRVADRILTACRAAGADATVLRLASSVVRDPEQEASFRRNVAGVEARLGRYVVVATNVVEMGVTFPSLDYVVTMDTEIETVRAHGGEVVQERPLGVNAFLQRIGRVGRRRPGMALLTREGDTGAAFSAWDVDDLATRLRLEPISFATTRGDVRELAFYLYQREVAADRKSVSEFLARGRMPSRPEQDPVVLDALVAERTAIRTAKLSDDGRCFNSRGERFRKIGVVNDLELGSLLADCLSAGPGSALPFLALVTAANPGGLRELLGRRTWLDDDEPVLSHAVPFARDAFGKPLADVVRVLRSGVSPVDPKAIGAEAVVAGHLTELLADGYRINDPQLVERKGEKEEPALLTLSRASIRLDPASELLAVYDIVRWFVMRYRPDLADTTLVDHERERVRAAAREDARLLGLDARRLLGVAARMEEIARHADMNLGEDLPPARLPDEHVARLATAAGVHRTGTDTSTLRREILRVYRENVRPRPTADLPEASLDDRRRFHRTIKNLELFTQVELQLGEDVRGRAAFLGVDPRTGNQIVLEKSRTCLRVRDRTLVRGRVVPVTGVDRDGNETMRYVLTLAHVEAR